MQDNELHGKNVLFIAPKFFNYYSNIENSMKFHGASVTLFTEIERNLLFRLSTKFSKKIKKYLLELYKASILKRAAQGRYDIVFVLRGFGLTPSFIKIF